MFQGTTNNNAYQYDCISANVIKSCVDTATSRIAKSKPRAFALPKRGDYRLRRKCKNLTKFLDGVLRAANIYKNGDDVFRDSCIYGDGYLLIEAEDGRIKSTIAKVDEVWIDQVTGMYNDPQEIFYEHPTPRAELLERYPEHAKEIEEARLSWPGAMAYMSQQDMVLVTTVWRKPSVKDGDDGRKVVAICNATLKDEPYTKNYLPIIRFSWTPPTYGCFGTGIAQELEGMQYTITQNIRDIDESCRMFAIPRIFVDSTNGMSQHMITDEMSVIKYTGSPPQFSTPAAMSPDVYQWVQWKIDYCFKQLGLSQLAAQSEKPAGLDSAVALRAYQDVETQRFALQGQRWENDFYMRAAEISLDLASDIYADTKKLSVNVPGANFIETVNWKDVSLEKDLFDIQVWPTNLLPETPEGKWAAVQEYINSGLMPRDVALSQMRMPILNDWIDEETAARDNIERMISLIEEKGKYVDPTGIGNIDLLVTLAQSAYLRSQFDELEPEKQDLLLRLLNRALELQSQKQAAAAPPPQPPPGGAKGPAVGQAPTPPPAPLAAAGSGPVQLPSAA